MQPLMKPCKCLRDKTNRMWRNSGINRRFR